MCRQVSLKWEGCNDDFYFEKKDKKQIVKQIFCNILPDIFIPEIINDLSKV